MNQLAKDDLIEVIQRYKKPLLGICLGMQLLYDFSTEGDVKCLGILSGNVEHFNPTNLIVPHMGWNNIGQCRNSALLDNVDLNRDVYFVHSYFVPITPATIASCDYGNQFSAIVGQDNFYGMQFHPEKSGNVGEQLLANFINIVKNYKE
jgi:glutamine amidotransferase